VGGAFGIAETHGELASPLSFGEAEVFSSDAYSDYFGRLAAAGSNI
jgi:hypothetical protein